MLDHSHHTFPLAHLFDLWVELIAYHSVFLIRTEPEQHSTPEFNQVLQGHIFVDCNKIEGALHRQRTLNIHLA